MQNLMFSLLVILLSKTSFAVSFEGTWFDENGGKIAIIQQEDKVILNNKTGKQVVKINGTVTDNKITITINNKALSGDISTDNAIIIWNNGNKWYRDLSGTWLTTDNSSLQIEQKGNVLRVKNSKNEVDYVGFLNESGISLLHKTTNTPVNGTLSKLNEILFANKSSWKKQ